jgi:hypothetical protein
MKSPRKHEALKQGHELWVAARLSEFLRSGGVVVDDLRAGDPSKREPDAVFTAGFERSRIK